MQTVIIGNSAAGLSALGYFRKYNRNSRLVLVSREAGPAYSRVLLPYYLSRRIGWKGLFPYIENIYRRNGVETHFENPVVGLDVKSCFVKLAKGEKIHYDRLLIATGSNPVKPPIENIDAPGIYHLWTLQDAVDIEKRFCAGKKLIVLGSGFISLMAADAAARRGLNVVVVELASRIMPRVLDEKSAMLLHKCMETSGVEVKVGARVEKVEIGEEGVLVLSLKDSSPLTADLVIVGTGVKPNLDVVHDTPISVERGILVNAGMETNIPGIYAAGDVAQGPTVFGEKHEVTPLWFTAVEQGKIAGANMAGQDFAYEGSLSLNVTQLFGLTVASMGRLELQAGTGKEVYCQNDSYAAIFREGETPVGAVTAGGPELVRILGYLRPYIKYQKVLKFSPAQLIDGQMAKSFVKE